jgi:hypothetical protein
LVKAGHGAEPLDVEGLKTAQILDKKALKLVKVEEQARPGVGLLTLDSPSNLNALGLNLYTSLN